MTSKEYAKNTLNLKFESDENSVRIVVFGGGTNCFSFGMHQNKFVIEMELKL